MPSANIILLAKLLETISNANHGPIDLTFKIQFDSNSEVEQALRAIQNWNMSGSLTIRLSILNHQVTFKVI